MTNKTEDYNILILAMSTLPIREGKVMENQFTWEGEDKSYPYISQLEPITRMLVKRGHCPDEVLMICTADTIERVFLHQLAQVDGLKVHARRVIL